MNDHGKLEHLSTHSQEIKWLGTPEHEQYQESWKHFYERYHTAIVNYILKRAGWKRDRMTDAEEIASVVYEKGFRWSFKKEKTVRFRVMLKRLVKDALSEYIRKQKTTTALPTTEIPTTHDITDSLSLEILEIAAKTVLKKYQGRQLQVLEWVWANGDWPSTEDIITICNIDSGDLEKSKQAARQWHKRNKGIWQDFQKRLRNEIAELAIGNDTQQEIEYFENLEA